MGQERYKIYRQEYPHFVTATFLKWLPLNSFPEIAEIILKALRYHQQEKGLTIYGWVFMENHTHFILKSPNLSRTLQSIKSYTAKQILHYLKSHNQSDTLNELYWGKKYHKTSQNFQVWQEGNHPKEIQSREMMLQKLEYIHNNPVKRGFVDKPEHWRYSSAKNYSGKEGVLVVCTKW